MRPYFQQPTGSRPTRTRSILQRCGSTSRGVAAVEFAVVLPPILLLILVSIEIAHGITVQHGLREACMNGCRIYSLGDKDQSDAASMIELSLSESGISGHTIEYSPATKAGIISEMQPVTVTISVPYSEVGLGIQWMLAGSSATASVTLPADSPPPPPF